MQDGDERVGTIRLWAWRLSCTPKNIWELLRGAAGQGREVRGTKNTIEVRINDRTKTHKKSVCIGEEGMHVPLSPQLTRINLPSLMQPLEGDGCLMSANAPTRAGMARVAVAGSTYQRSRHLRTVRRIVLLTVSSRSFGGLDLIRTAVQGGTTFFPVRHVEVLSISVFVQHVLSTGERGTWGPACTPNYVFSIWCLCTFK